MGCFSPFIMARLEEAHYTREITHPSNWLKPSSQSLESNENAENAPKKKSMDRISRLFQKKPKKKTQAHPISLTSSFSSLSLASSELSPVSDVHPMMESQHMRRGLSGMASGSLLQPIESTESHSSTSNLLKGEGIKPESGNEAHYRLFS
ncbi:hypothetical protein BDF14DRAFT_1750954 [Spinellus fusiger]|nr:hypothetical protein BDF14DRAFT_1750954 [Spinellus fusiger]